MARPIEYTEERIEEINETLEKYINDNPIPIIAEFAYKNNIRRATLYEIPALAYAIKRLIEKKEANLEKLAIANKINTTMAIFSLKQLGWADKQELEHSGEITTKTIDLTKLSKQELEDLEKLTAKLES